MKIFLSWSGEQAKGVAAALRTFVRACLPGTDPWFSDEILDGMQWHREIYKRIDDADLGIVCLARTNFKDNWVRSWLGFEAGMLANKGRLVILSVGLDRKVFDHTPFAFYQITTHERESVFRMLKAINEHAAMGGDMRKSQKQLHRAFDRHWPKLEEALSAAVDLEYTWAERKEMLERLLANDASRGVLTTNTVEPSTASTAAEQLFAYAQAYGQSELEPASERVDEDPPARD